MSEASSSSAAPHFVSSAGIDHSKLQGGYGTVVKAGSREDVPYAVELAERYLSETRKSKISIRKLDKIAKRIVRMAYLQPDDNIDPVEYDEAVASGLIEPYDEDRQDDRIFMAAVIAQDILEGNVVGLDYRPELPSNSE
jgi:hypothetical protein